MKEDITVEQRINKINSLKSKLKEAKKAVSDIQEEIFIEKTKVWCMKYGVSHGVIVVSGGDLFKVTGVCIERSNCLPPKVYGLKLKRDKKFGTLERVIPHGFTVATFWQKRLHGIVSDAEVKDWILNSENLHP